MANYVTYDPVTGEIHRYGTCAAGMVQYQSENGMSAIEGEGSPESGYVLNGEITAYSEPQRQAKAARPKYPSLWSNESMQWSDLRSLVDVKATANQRINASRLQANQTSFTYLGKDIAADSLSRSDIDGVNGEIGNTGAYPTGWPGGWKCMDNTYVSLATIQDWRDFYTAMVNQGSANFAHAQTLKAQIAVATTIAEVEAVQW